MALTKDRRESLKRLFRKKAYRSSYVEGFYSTWLATQIKVLRESTRTSQKSLAKSLETQQSVISKLERSDYASWNVRTLRKLARAFDVALQVRFVSFGEALADIDSFEKGALAKTAFADDPIFQVAREKSATVMAGDTIGAILAGQRRALAEMNAIGGRRFAELDVPGVHIPEFKIPEFKIPELKMPEVRIPDRLLPAFQHADLPQTHPAGYAGYVLLKAETTATPATVDFAAANDNLALAS